MRTDVTRCLGVRDGEACAGVSKDRPRVVVRVWSHAPSALDLPFLEAA